MVNKQITFGTVKIQKLNRVAIPKALLNNLNLAIGSEIEFFLDIQKEEILVKPLKGDKND